MLDEPSMGLAPIFVEQIFETIVEINEQGTPILLVEQNALMALDVADRGYVLETGQIALAGDGQEPARERAGAQDVPRRGVGAARRGAVPAREVGCTRAPEREVRRREQEADPRCAAGARPPPSRARRRVPCVGTKPNWRAAVASRQPATSTAPSRSISGSAAAQSAKGSSGWHARPCAVRPGSPARRRPRPARPRR